MELLVFDVGAGDNLLIKSNENEYSVIDFKPFKYSSLRAPSSVYLKKEYKNNPDLKINSIFITHFHSDHFTGSIEFIDWLIDEFNIQKNHFLFYIPRGPNLEKYEETIEDCLKKNIKIPVFGYFIQKLLTLKKINKLHFLEFGDVVDLKIKNLDGFIFAPNSNDIESYQTSVGFDIPANKNLLSLGIKLKFKDKRLILAGDVEKKSFIQAISDCKLIGRKLSGDLYKVPHHGAVNGSDKKIWSEVLLTSHKSKVIYSCGTGYPKIDVINEASIISHEPFTTNQLFQSYADSNQIDLGIDKNLIKLNSDNFNLSSYLDGFPEYGFDDKYNSDLLPEIYKTCFSANIDSNFIGYKFGFSEEEIKSEKLIHV